MPSGNNIYTKIHFQYPWQLQNFDKSFKLKSKRLISLILFISILIEYIVLGIRNVVVMM